MSGRNMLSRALATAGFVLLTMAGPTGLTASVAAPQAPSPGATPATSSATPSPRASDASSDDPTDDGTSVTPAQTGTWLAIGGAVAVSLVAGLVVALRRR